MSYIDYFYLREYRKIGIKTVPIPWQESGDNLWLMFIANEGLFIENQFIITIKHFNNYNYELEYDIFQIHMQIFMNNLGIIQK